MLHKKYQSELIFNKVDGSSQPGLRVLLYGTGMCTMKANGFPLRVGDFEKYFVLRGEL